MRRTGPGAALEQALGAPAADLGFGGEHMREIAVLTFDGRLISSLRKYWASETETPAESLLENLCGGG